MERSAGTAPCPDSSGSASSCGASPHVLTAFRCVTTKAPASLRQHPALAYPPPGSPWLEGRRYFMQEALLRSGGANTRAVIGPPGLHRGESGDDAGCGNSGPRPVTGYAPSCMGHSVSSVRAPPHDWFWPTRPIESPDQWRFTF